MKQRLKSEVERHPRSGLEATHSIVIFPEDFETFGSNVPLGTALSTREIALSFIFRVSDDSSYMPGQVLHPNGGTVVNGQSGERTRLAYWRSRPRDREICFTA